ncbi:MAG: MBOAT family O-acyltransferase [Clostridia bacterium]|nr:MBOAT family O-acyltransferase [Clostridia bacterium]
MVFSSIVFLGAFLPVVLLLYFISGNRTWRNFILLIASMLFYAWGEPIWVAAMAALALIDYLGGLMVGRIQGAGAKKAFLVLMVILNLALLFMFKYFNFLMDSVGDLVRLLGGTGFSFARFPFAMPIGISFFTFQALSYVLDVYRGDAAPQKNYFYLLLYISMFPQLIAGPIVRYTDVEYEILNRRESASDFANGAFRFCVGLGKKVILANYAGGLATTLLSTNLNALSASGAWVGMLMYTAQIYFDFSGYSDMAIGLGHIFGFNFKENFNYPYASRTVTEFWRRWHISLSSFFRDYVYIPLGGNRKHQYLNILIVWALTGLWHGASWNFVIWGLYYAALLCAEKLLKKNDIDMGKIPFISNILLLLIVSFGWAVFYYTDASQLWVFCRSLLGLANADITMSLRELTAVNELFFLFPVLALAATPIPAKVCNRLFAGRGIEVWVKTLWAAVLLVVCFMMIMNQTYNPFLYFRF